MREEYDFSEGIRGKFFDDAGPRFPASSEESDWSGPSEQLGEFITEQVKKTLDAYQSQPTLIREHANTEQDAFMGGYARRQLFELVQNSADALSEAPEGESILVRMTKEYLYCADNGTAIDEDGVRALMFHNVSGKRSTSQIGKFGRGFKSVLGVTDAPEFYSHSVSFRFDRTRARQRIAKIASNKHNPEHCPVLRFPEPFDPDESIGTDKDLEELMSWATNIVRLPLKSGVREDLVQQFQDFPPEFMLFVEHVRHLTLEHEDESRSFMLSRCDSEIRLDTGNERRHWRKFDIRHRLSPQARQDWHLSGEDVLISWAAPLDRLDRPGHFWAHFPTENPSLVAGILNAQWKLSEDRLNLLPGVYNKELIIATAEMIVEKLPELVSNDDPARHLDALPRREESGDGDLVRKLRDRLFSLLEGRDIVPDQDCNLQMIGDISYPPKELKGCDDALKRWSDYAGRPRKWLHHKALTRNRLAAIDRLFDNNRSSHHFLHTHHGPSAPRAEISQWLEALVDYHRQPDEIAEASIAAVQTAALIPKEKRSERLGKIILTAAGTLVKPNDQEIFLPSENRFNREQSTDPESCVHPDLISDSETLEALKKIGLTEPSPESRLNAIVHRILRQNDCDQEVYEALHEEFWLASRDLSREDVERIIGSEGNLIKKLRVRTQAGTWLPTFSVLRPGKIIPDDRRDRGFTVDSQFHESDDALLCKFGVTEAPDKRDLSREPEFETYLKVCKYRFREKAFKETGKKPHESLLKFETCDGCGPLDILKRLSDEGRVAYTNELLSQDATFTPWTMRHKTQDKYSKLAFNCLSIHALRNYGRIKTASGQIVPFEDALDPTPRCPEARDELLKHPMADKIKEAFDLADPIPEFLGEGDAIPLTDCWPGLNDHLPPHLNRCRIIPCEQIRVLGESRECIFYSRDIYFRGAVDNEERHMLRSVVDELGLDLHPRQIKEVWQRKTPDEIKQRRARIKQCSTDAERLLAAVGDKHLRSKLPNSLLGVLEMDGKELTGIEVAKAAIATYHTDALKQYKEMLDNLNPPQQWAGSNRAVEFVRSLGFSTEWAGQRNRKPEPYLEVEGRYRLPDLHDYQKKIVENIQDMFCDTSPVNPQRRGMISLPTGSGKTRVAVEAIVKAICKDKFQGGVLWVADREELCEQAVDAWRRVWSSIGIYERRLRISRMWGGQEKPSPTCELHTVIATIQTLRTRLENNQGSYDFLKDFRLIVFDEAHRSVAPTFTSVMEETGLTRRQGADEPFVIGLTATPYRGYNEQETRWLANRYGRNRLDAGAFGNDDAQHVVQQLQNEGVLAQVDHSVIEGESFTIEESDRSRDLHWLPQSVEDRIAQSAKRTKRIIEAYREHIDPEWSALIFATSVEHARTVAALLDGQGIRSRAVSGDTETAMRRRVVEEFRSGKIKALVNYGVFREGFDAPRTRAIIVARPVYSPNLYFQMIGRGLRGQRNGGNKRCLILNVQDNIENFDRSLAFSELDWLWSRTS